MDRRVLLKLVSLTALVLSGAGVVQAQTYPNHAIKIIVGFPPGGGTDIAARLIGQKLSDALGQPVIVENRPGAGGTVGNLAVAKSPPDGYTLLLTANGPHAIAPSLYTNLGYDIFKDYAPISMVSSNPQLVAVHPSVPAKSVPELIAWLRAQPAETPATFSSGGNGTPGHLAGELFAAMAGVKLKHVPSRGAAPALAGLLGGEVKVTFGDLAVAVPYASSDKLKPIAVTSLTRSPILPNLPTLDESGLKGYEALVWTGLLAPAGTPPAIVARLNAEMQRIATLPDIKERFAQLSADVAIGTPEAFSDQVRRDFDQWAKVIKDAGIKIQQ
jgi:tripartite-type tricarboxylate transporter receptor subunit TctC